MQGVYITAEMVRKIFSLFILFLVHAHLYSQTIPVDLYQTLKNLHYPPTHWILVVSVKKQTLYLFKEGKLVNQYIIATAKNGTGQQEGSEKTPLGLHCIASKYGSKARPHTIFRSRKDTGRICSANSRPNEDLVVTRILCLDGLEEGINSGIDASGCNVDSGRRFIYIHGTNHEEDLGSPTSKGCIRMSSKDIIELFDKVPEGSLVWISLI